MKNYLFLVFLFYVFLSACTNDIGGKPKPITSPCDTMTVLYSTMIKPIVDAKCATVSGCHISGSNGNGFDYTTYDGLKAEVDNGSLQKRVIDGDPTFMPPSGGLPKDEKQKFECWIKAKGPNN